MKRLLLTTIAAVILVGCAVTRSQNSAELHSAEGNATGHKDNLAEKKAKPPSISIHKAARVGDIAAVRQHLLAGTDPNLNQHRPNRPLFYANDIEILTLLVENGADVNDIGGVRTALHVHRNPKNVMFLVKHGADIKATDDFGVTPLHTAGVYPETVKFLVSKGADVNAIDDDGNTPLHEMLDGYLYMQKESVEILITAGANVNELNFDGFTPLDNFLTKLIAARRHEKLKRELEGLLRKHGAKTSEELNHLNKEKIEDKGDGEGLDILIKA